MTYFFFFLETLHCLSTYGGINNDTEKTNENKTDYSFCTPTLKYQLLNYF